LSTVSSSYDAHVETASLNLFHTTIHLEVDDWQVRSWIVIPKAEGLKSQDLSCAVRYQIFSHSPKPTSRSIPNYVIIKALWHRQTDRQIVYLLWHHHATV